MVRMIDHKEADKVQLNKYLSVFEEYLAEERMEYTLSAGNETIACIYGSDSEGNEFGEFARILVHPCFDHLGKPIGSLEIAINDTIAQEKEYFDRIDRVAKKLQSTFRLKVNLHKYIDMTG